jgi:hypothetical protein
MIAQGAPLAPLLRSRQLLLQERDKIEHFVLFFGRQLTQLVLNLFDPSHVIFLARG